MPQDLRQIDAWQVAAARAAFARLMAHRGPRPYAHARRLTDDADTARDITQAAWVAARTAGSAPF